MTTTGHLIFARADSLWAAPFDASRLKLDDEPVPVLQGVRTNFDFAHYALGGDGSLVYVAGAAGISPQLTLVWVDRNGREEPVGTIPQSGQYIYPRISPDGTRVALGIKHDVSGDTDLWVLGIESGSRTQLTFGGENQFFPVWTPDGARLTFADGIDPTNRIRWTPAGGGGEMTALLDRGRRQFPTSWASDGLALAFYEDQTGTQTGRDLWILPVDADGTPGTPVEFLATSFEERAATFSPNGRWLAYVSDKSGQDEVYVRPYPSAGPQEHTISTSGGKEPVWSPDGRELFYRTADQVMVVSVDTAGPFRYAGPEVLFVGSYGLDTSISGGVPNYDVAPDGQRFLMIKAADTATDDTSTEIVLVLNWIEELKALVPTDR